MAEAMVRSIIDCQEFFIEFKYFNIYYNLKFVNELRDLLFDISF